MAVRTVLVGPMVSNWLQAALGALWHIATISAQGARPLAPVFVSIVLLELVAPCIGPRPTWGGRLEAAKAWSVYFVFGSLVMAAIGGLIADLHIQPLLKTWRWPGLIGFLAGGASAILFGDLCYYWLHRFQYRFLWRLHSVHHSARELSGVAAFHHFSEIPIQGLFWMVPVGLIVPDPSAVPLFGGLAFAWGHIIHSPVRAKVPVLVGNRFHRIHHSLEPQHFDKNFGALVPWWDRLFGTAFEPAVDEWPDVGLPDGAQVTTVGDLLLAGVMPPGFDNSKMVNSG